MYIHSQRFRARLRKIGQIDDRCDVVTPAGPQHQGSFSMLVRVSRRRRHGVFPHVVVSQDLRMRHRVTIEARNGYIGRNYWGAASGGRKKRRWSAIWPASTVMTDASDRCATPGKNALR